ncbi:GL26421 [Drosophila persimilis]|uniref:GL26421 n=1 Tax=Drosophila persimilis TaxID=7234 RepID=B4GST8_DROPE|nr:GL26421 [Drosophila persimilis]
MYEYEVEEDLKILLRVFIPSKLKSRTGTWNLDWVQPRVAVQQCSSAAVWQSGPA